MVDLYIYIYMCTITLNYRSKHGHVIHLSCYIHLINTARAQQVLKKKAQPGKENDRGRILYTM